MKRRRLVFSDAAITDILEQADWYFEQSGHKLAQRWEKAVKSASRKLPDGLPRARCVHSDLRL